MIQGQVAQIDDLLRQLRIGGLIQEGSRKGDTIQEDSKASSLIKELPN